MPSSYLKSIIKQLEYTKSLGDKTMKQLTDEQLFWQYNAESNSIAIIVKHLWGNMLSRWTNFLTEDGEKEWRKREEEFDADIKTRKELLEKWEGGWNCLFNAIAPLTEEDVEKTIYIRNQGHTVIEAVNRQLGHYSMHIGQMIFLGKMLKGSEWESLSIPRGKSAEFNAAKFSQEKHTQHFTDEFINKKPQTK